jgi:son of sevenless-like protein
VFLSDLTFIEQGNMNTVHHGLINWEKRKLIYSIVSQVRLYQQAPYTFEKNPLIQSFFANFVILDENEMYKKSLLREPRDAPKSALM